MKLNVYEVESWEDAPGGSHIRIHCFRAIVIARSRQEAAQVGFDRADEEMDIRLTAMSVCTMTLPEGRGGIVMCNDDTRWFRRRGRRIVQMTPREVEET
jgi:hypothetical protein